MTDNEFAAIVERNLSRFVGVVAKHLRLQPSDAQDVTQAALEALWIARDQFRGENDAETWMIAAVINKGIRYLRREKMGRIVMETVGKPDPDCQPDAYDMRIEQIMKNLENLPPCDRELIDRAFFKNESHETLADAYGVTFGTMRNRISRIIKRLGAQCATPLQGGD